MDGVVTAMSLEAADLFAFLASAAPIIGIAILVSFGLGIISAIIEGLNQGKATIAHRGRWDDGVDGIKSGKYHG